MTDYYQQSLELHEKWRGKLGVASKVPMKTIDDLSVAYTPGVAEPCRAIAKDADKVWDLTMKGNMIAVVTDGSAVLGLGNIGSRAGLPVMEGKCLFFKEYAGVDAVPICLETQDTDEIVQTIVNIAPTFGGINLEDIAAPVCFEVERQLKEKLDIPVFHDDQHGTAIVTLAGLLNALKVAGKQIDEVKMVMSGAGAAGIAIANLLLLEGAKDIVLFDSKGAVEKGRTDMDPDKAAMAERTNPRGLTGSLAEALKGADVFIGVSAPGLVTSEMVASMNEGAIVFAMANPDPEIMPRDAKEGGAAIVATGRSDFPNQINNVLAFPGVFRGLLDGRAHLVTPEMLARAAHALSELVPEPTAEKIIPSPLESGVVGVVAQAVKSCC